MNRNFEDGRHLPQMGPRLPEEAICLPQQLARLTMGAANRQANNPDTKAIDRVSAIVTDNNHPGKTV